MSACESQKLQRNWLCFKPTQPRRKGSWYCSLCNSEWVTPREYSRRHRLTPFDTRLKIHWLPIHASRPRGKNDSRKTPLKSGRRKQPRIIAQFPVEFRFKADSGNFQIVQGITSNLHEEGVSCRLSEPIPATASYAYLSVVTDQKQCAVSGSIMWINSLGNECGVKVENATTDWKQFILATLNDARTSLSSDRRSLNRR